MTLPQFLYYSSLNQNKKPRNLHFKAWLYYKMGKIFSVYDLIKTNRSLFIVAASVVGMP